MAAHTSRDSYLKYKWLADKQFDLIVFYHGINEARANNVPPGLFDPQYEHYSWYRYVNAISPDGLSQFVALPYVATYFWLKLSEKLGIVKVVPVHNPRKDWIKYGKKNKTTASFRTNLNAIIEIATSRNEPLLLMTFATYVPIDYSKSRFNALQLDYTRHTKPIEIWGAKEHVNAALSSHNSVIREAAANNPQLLFVDQDQLMPKRREYFNDICHFTVSGSQRFVDHMVGIVLKAVRGTRTNY